MDKHELEYSDGDQKRSEWCITHCSAWEHPAPQHRSVCNFLIISHGQSRPSLIV